MSIACKIAPSLSQTGFGFDSHLFSTSGMLVLGGIKFPGVPALLGHSDGDALLHAVIDALLGAAALGDIGDLFPDTSKKLKGIDSRKLLSETMRRVTKAAWRVSHVDVIVLADRPKLGGSKIKIKNALAKIMKITSSNINIKAKTQEGLLLFKQPGGIAVWAVATVVPS